MPDARPLTVQEVAPCMTVPQVATVLAVNRATVYRLIDAGDLHCYRVGGSVRVGKHHLAEYLARSECRGHEPIQNGASVESPTAPPGTPTDGSTADLNGFRSERRMRVALDKRSQISTDTLTRIGF